VKDHWSVLEKLLFENGPVQKLLFLNCTAVGPKKSDLFSIPDRGYIVKRIIYPLIHFRIRILPRGVARAATQRPTGRHGTPRGCQEPQIILLSPLIVRLQRLIYTLFKKQRS